MVMSHLVILDREYMFDTFITSLTYLTKKKLWQPVRVFFLSCLCVVLLFLSWCGSNSSEMKTITIDTVIFAIPLEMTNMTSDFLFSSRDSSSVLTLTKFPHPLNTTIFLEQVSTLPAYDEWRKRTKDVCGWLTQYTYSFIPAGKQTEYITQLIRGVYLITITSNDEDAHERFDDIRHTFVCD